MPLISWFESKVLKTQCVSMQGFQLQASVTHAKHSSSTESASPVCQLKDSIVPWLFAVFMAIT